MAHPRNDLVLGIETSCDETAAAVVAGGCEVLSSVVETQIAEHAPFGGVVPEIASRSHLRTLPEVIDRALSEARVELGDLASIAVTNRPGLIGSLLVGVSTAKALAFGAGLPIVAVDHIEAHVYAATMEHFAREAAARTQGSDPQGISGSTLYPCIALVVSGGHTALFRAHSPLHIEPLAKTLDDAAGEAFDKVAHLLGLPYPGGPAVAQLALEGDPELIAFPRYRPRDGRPGFSFSGLKTAVLYHLRGNDALASTPAPEDIPDRAHVAASFQEAVVDALATQTLRAAEAEGLDTCLVSGGVACNQRLRSVLGQRAAERGLRAWFPAPAYCTDNAAMIAGLGWRLFEAGRTASWDLDASPRRTPAAGAGS